MPPQGTATPLLLERRTSPSPTSQENATTGVLASLQKAIESLVDKMDRYGRHGQLNIAASQTHAPLQSPARTYTFGSKERQKYATQFERLVQTPDMHMATYSAKFCKLARYSPLLVPTEEYRVKRFVHGLVSCLFSSLVPNMSTMTYSEAIELDRKIEEKGREKHTTYDVHKKAKIGGSYSGNLSENHKIWNQGKQQGSH
uniref:Uncharacterized protein n=1 Tax=Solanum lycopersicum TaxID=4081 RepID=K4C473_SOLLC